MNTLYLYFILFVVSVYFKEWHGAPLAPRGETLWKVAGGRRWPDQRFFFRASAIICTREGQILATTLRFNATWSVELRKPEMHRAHTTSWSVGLGRRAGAWLSTSLDEPSRNGNNKIMAGVLMLSFDIFRLLLYSSLPL